MRHLQLVLVFALALGCTESTYHEPVREISELGVPGDSASAEIGPAGGVLSLGEATVRIPAGALEVTTTLRFGGGGGRAAGHLHGLLPGVPP